MNGKYDDIMHLSRPISANRAKMSALDRAAQFSPFAALTGYEAAIEETGRRTEAREEASDDRRGELDRVLHQILERLKEGPQVRILRFVPDTTKSGGEYVSGDYRIRKIDLYHRELWASTGERIPMDDIWSMELIGSF